MWEDMSDGSQRIFCQLPDSWLTQCGKTWVTAASESIVSCSTHGWLNAGRLESRWPIQKSSWHVSILPHCGKKCDRPCQDFDHSDSFKDVHGCFCCGVVRSVCCSRIILSNLTCMRSVSRYIVVVFIVALTRSDICVVHSCGQVLFRFVIVVGPVAVGQARLSSEFAVVH